MGKPVSILALALWLCLSGRAEAEALKTRVVVAIPLTGVLAEYGQALRNGFELAKRIEPNSFRRVEFIYEDNRYDNVTAASIVNSYAGRAGETFIYMWGYGPANASAKIAEARHVPMAAVSGERGLTRRMNSVIRFCYRIEQFSDALLAYMRRRGFRRVGVVLSESTYNRSILNGMLEGLHRDELVDVVDVYQSSDTDFRSTSPKLKERRYDALGLFLMTGQVSQILKQNAALGVRFPLLGGSVFETSSEIQQAGGLLEGGVFPATDVTAGFRANYLAEFNNDSQLGWAANAFDFATLTGRIASNAARPLSGQELLAELRGVKAFQGAEGNLFFRDDPENGSGFEYPIVMKRIENGRIAIIEESRRWSGDD